MATPDSTVPASEPRPTVGGVWVHATPDGKMPYGSLWDMAESVYGYGPLWREIYRANRSRIGDDPSHIPDGLSIGAPDMERSTIPSVRKKPSGSAPPSEARE